MVRERLGSTSGAQLIKDSMKMVSLVSSDTIIAAVERGNGIGKMTAPDARGEE